MAGDATGGWVASAASTTAALTASSLKAAVASTTYYIEKVVFCNEGAANSLILKDSDGTAVYPPSGAIYLGVDQTFDSGVLPYRIAVTTAKGLTATTTANDHACVIVHGYTG